MAYRALLYLAPVPSEFHLISPSQATPPFFQFLRQAVFISTPWPWHLPACWRDVQHHCMVGPSDLSALSLNVISSERPSQPGHSLSHHPALFSSYHLSLSDSFLFIFLFIVYLPLLKCELHWCGNLPFWFSVISPGPGTMPGIWYLINFCEMKEYINHHSQHCVVTTFDLWMTCVWTAWVCLYTDLFH